MSRIALAPPTGRAYAFSRMRICTQCGHKLTADEFLCPACELWDSRQYTDKGRKQRPKTLVAIYVGRLQDALALRELCESCGIPAFVDASERVRRMGGLAGQVKVSVPADMAEKVNQLLSRVQERVTGPGAETGTRRRRTWMKSRLSVRRRAYQALALAIGALLLPPLAFLAASQALGVLRENRALPVVTEETRVARAALFVSAAAVVVLVVVAVFFVRMLAPAA